MHRARRFDAGNEARANAGLEAIARQKARELLSVVELRRWNSMTPTARASSFGTSL